MTDLRLRQTVMELSLYRLTEVAHFMLIIISAPKALYVICGEKLVVFWRKKKEVVSDTVT